MATTDPARIALTPADAAQTLGVSEHYFREHVDHELAWVVRGRKRLVAITELQRWLTDNGERVLDR